MVLQSDYGTYASRKCSDGTYHHALDIKLLVETTPLWESGRSYIWKFLGQNEWTIDGGTVITVNRIHVKD